MRPRGVSAPLPARRRLVLLLCVLLLTVLAASLAQRLLDPARTTAGTGGPSPAPPTTPPTGLAVPSTTATLIPGAATGQGNNLIQATKTVGPGLPLAGRRIGLDPGHGPRADLGVVLLDPDTGKLVLSEDEFNLNVALRCRDLLIARGASVILTRENAKTFTAPWPSDANGDGIVGGSKDDLQERVDILNSFHSEVFLSIHANSAPRQKNGRGVQVFYCGDSDCAFPGENKRVGQLVMSELQAKLGAAGYPVQDAELHSDTWADGLHLFVLGPVNLPSHVRAIQMPGVLSESLYVSAPAEAAQLRRDSVRQAIALAYADALQSFLLGSGSGR